LIGRVDRKNGSLSPEFPRGETGRSLHISARLETLSWKNISVFGKLVVLINRIQGSTPSGQITGKGSENLMKMQRT
jgi:hypothetical protein